MIDIVNSFKDRYDSRVLITGYLNPRNQPLDDDVRIDSMVQYNRSSTLKRITTWVMGFLKALWLIKTKYRKADLFLVSNPPLSPLIPLFGSNRYKILIYDVYPDALVEFGHITTNSWINRVWQYLNRKVYASADQVYTLTDGMKQRISAYVEESKISVVPLWSDNNFLKPIPKGENPFVEEMQWQGKFIVMYSGNLGRSHPVEIMVELAKRCENPNIHFVIIGSGDKYATLTGMIDRLNKTNIQILPWQPTEKLPYTLAAADVGVVTLANEASDLGIPSKTLGYLSVGKPILAFCPENSSLAKLLTENKSGFVLNHSEYSNTLRCLNKLIENPALYSTYCSNSLILSELINNNKIDDKF